MKPTALKRWMMLLLLVWLAATTCPRPTHAAGKIPVVIDTDLGSDPDDAIATALLLVSDELDVRAVTTSAPSAQDRAWMVCRLLTEIKRSSIPVAWGRSTDPFPQHGPKIDEQIQYRKHPSVVWSRTARPSKDSASQLIARTLKASEDKVIVIATGALTNIARALHVDRSLATKIEAIYYHEHDGKRDTAALKLLKSIGVKLRPTPVGKSFELNTKFRHQLFAAHTNLTFQIQTLYDLWNKKTPVLRATVSATACLGAKRPRNGAPGDAWIKWLINRLSKAGNSALPKPPGNVSKPVSLGMMPKRVHVFEDFETDIERRWWLTGKLETQHLPPNAIGKRAMRAVLTQDYDAKMGDTDAVYRAVVFNPVPGPPMGPNTRLSFRCWLQGTGSLRVQIFSLSKGYHRHLALNGLQENKWLHLAVDMTKARRPDGSGGSLAEDERIDDIQFYIDPRGELIVDDIVLYEVANKNESRLFPGRPIFTGWFDTGKQGKEWPGDFEIVLHKKPLTWDAIKPTKHTENGNPFIRVHMRGDRSLGKNTQLRFRYHVNSDTTLKVGLTHTKSKWQTFVPVKVKKGQWQETEVTLPGKTDQHVDNIVIEAPNGTKLLLDDLLLYEQAKTDTYNKK